MTAYLYVKANALYGTRISPSQHGVLVSAHPNKIADMSTAPQHRLWQQELLTQDLLHRQPE